MKEKPKTQGDLRELMAGAIWDVRYGHLEIEKLDVMSKGLDSINNSLRTEISAWALMVQLGKAQTHELGSLPLNTASALSELEDKE
jgi:hypothetical protein